MKRLLAALLIIFTLSLSSYAYFIYIPEKIENKIIYSFKNFGFEELKFGNITRNNGKITFSDISLDKKEFSSIGKLDVHFSLLEFMLNPSHAQKIIISNMVLSGEISKGDISFSGWNNDDNILQSLKNIPANIVVIKNATMDILSDEIGGIKIDYNGRFKPSKNGGIEIKGQANSLQKKLAFQAKINGKISPDGILSMTAQCDQISLTQKDLSIKRGTASINLQHSIGNSTASISAEGDFSSVNWRNMPLRDVHSTLEYNHDNYVLSANGTTFGNENIKWKTKIINDGNINAKTTITPSSLNDLLSFLSFNHRLQEKLSFPAFILNMKQPVISIDTKINDDGIISGDFKFINNAPIFELGGKFISNKNTKNIKGKFALTNPHIDTIDKKARFKQRSLGEFIIRNIEQVATLEWYLNTKINEGSINYGTLNIKDINGKFLYNSRSPKKSERYLNFKLPLKQDIKQSGKISINLTDGNKPLVGNMSLNIYGGNIKTQSPIFKGGVLSNNIKLTISDIDLAPFFRDARFKRARIYGQLGGVLPLTIDSNKININGGLLQSQGSGVIRLAPSIIAELFPEKDQKAALIKKALRNYHYDFFEIRLDGDLTGQVMVTINANGRNPDINNAEPVDISLHIETNASTIFKNLVK